ncbi:hypothetical protein TNCV_5060991 [Trichonephila clavipes]|nr:hypothetical protein TNCV_5060991 [Trichonephila clavipes]
MRIDKYPKGTPASEVGCTQEGDNVLERKQTQQQCGLLTLPKKGITKAVTKAVLPEWRTRYCAILRFYNHLKGMKGLRCLTS